MVGVPQAFTGATNAAVIRGVPGGGIPWRLDLGKGELSTGGHLEIKVRGLVLASGGNAGNNPVGVFSGLVSCLTSDAAVVNIANRRLPGDDSGRRRRAAATRISRPTSTCQTRASRRSSS